MMFDDEPGKTACGLYIGSAGNGNTICEWHPRKSEVPSALHFDRETKTILIDKDLLIVAIQIISPYQGNKEICKEFNCSPATAVKIMKNVKVANKDKKNPYERKVPLSWVDRKSVV